MRWIFVFCGAVLGFCLGPGGLAAQEAQQVIRPGDRIRVYRVAEPERGVSGTFVARDETDLQLTDDSAGLAIRIPLVEVSRLERSSGRHGHTLLGLGIGAGVGLGVGLAGAATTGSPGAYYDVGAGDVVLITAVFGGAGALVGTVIRSDSWTEVPLATLEPAPVAPDTTGPIAAER
jgi:hypothetical protein